MAANRVLVGQYKVVEFSKILLIQNVVLIPDIERDVCFDENCIA